MDVGEAAGPEGGVEDDEVGEVLVHAAEAVGEPGTERRFAGDFGAGAEEGFAGIVVDRGGGGGIDEGDVIGDGAEMGEELGEVHAALAMLFKLEHGGGDELLFAASHGGDALALADGFWERFAEAFVKVGFVVEEVELAWSAGHEKEDHALGPRTFGCACGVLGCCVDRSSGLGIESAEDGSTKSHAGGVEELAAGLDVEHWILEGLG